MTVTALSKRRANRLPIFKTGTYLRFENETLLVLYVRTDVGDGFQCRNVGEHDRIRIFPLPLQVDQARTLNHSKTN